MRLRAFTAPDSLKELEKKIKELEQEKSAAVNAQDFELAAQIRDEEKQTKEKLEQAKNAWDDKNLIGNSEVTPEDIARYCFHLDGNSSGTVDRRREQATASIGGCAS